MNRTIFWSVVMVLSFILLASNVQDGRAQTPGAICEFDATGICEVDSPIFDRGGLIGIGTTTPGARLDVAESGLGIPVIQAGRATSGPAIQAVNLATDIGAVGFLAEVFGDGEGVRAKTITGTGVVGLARDAGRGGSFGRGRGGLAGTQAALEALNSTDSGEGLWVGLTSESNPFGVLKLVLPSASGADFMTCQRPDGIQRCHVTADGTFVSGSDFAEALPARGPRVSYEPGDVLAMTRDGGGVEKASEAYSRRVAGVHSTRPGLLGADKNGESRVNPDDVPVAIIGIVPTKVSAENGAIEVGDLLVSASTPGHAMKGTDRGQMLGAVVGKALEPLRSGKAIVRVLVNLQ